MPNFPSEISENIVKYAFYKKYKFYPQWNIKSGDLIVPIKNNNIIIKVKSFSSLGPSSFGPNEKWDILYFVYAINYIKQKFIIYEIKLSNSSEIFSNIKINKNETYKFQCLQKRRPRINFYNLFPQIKKYTTIIFDGYFRDLKN